ncbi:MAG: hypothetical protein H0V46_00150 [Sphingomonas sp.]|nr:hypothetical protein [Sphingomonas sp.]
MAKKATKSGGGGRKRGDAKPKAASAARKSAGRKPASSPRTASRKPAGAKATQPRRAASATRAPKRSSSMTAADALQKLIESPLVADLLAVGATAALAAIAGRGLSRGGTGGTVKAAGKAAAAAMGRRLSTEVEEIRNASRAKGDAATD